MYNSPVAEQEAPVQVWVAAGIEAVVHTGLAEAAVHTEPAGVHTAEVVIHIVPAEVHTVEAVPHTGSAEAVHTGFVQHIAGAEVRVVSELP